MINLNDPLLAAYRTDNDENAQLAAFALQINAELWENNIGPYSAAGPNTLLEMAIQNFTMQIGNLRSISVDAWFEGRVYQKYADEIKRAYERYTKWLESEQAQPDSSDEGNRLAEELESVKERLTALEAVEDESQPEPEPEPDVVEDESTDEEPTEDDTAEEGDE